MPLSDTTRNEEKSHRKTLQQLLECQFLEFLATFNNFPHPEPSAKAQHSKNARDTFLLSTLQYCSDKRCPEGLIFSFIESKIKHFQEEIKLIDNEKSKLDEDENSFDLQDYNNLKHKRNTYIEALKEISKDLKNHIQSVQSVHKVFKMLSNKNLNYHQLTAFLAKKKPAQTFGIKPLKWAELMTAKEFMLELNQYNFPEDMNNGLSTWKTQLNNHINQNTQAIFDSFKAKINDAKETETVHQLVTQCRFLLMDCPNYSEYKEQISKASEKKMTDFLKNKLTEVPNLRKTLHKYLAAAGTTAAAGVAISTGHHSITPHIMHLVNTIGHSAALHITSAISVAGAAVGSTGLFKFCKKREAQNNKSTNTNDRSSPVKHPVQTSRPAG